MTLIVSNDGVQLVAGALRGVWYNAFLVGLYRNDWTPHHSMNIGMVQPANFSGYDGPRVLNTWGPPTFDGTRATLTGPLITWTHDGGPVAGLVFGYYVTTPDGVLTWAERVDPPTWLTAAGQAYRVQPRFTVRSEF